MLKHMVFFKMKPGLTQEQMDAFTRALADLPKVVPLIKNWHQGPNISPRHHEYDYGEVCEFDDLGALNAYVDHPAHVNFVPNYLTPYVAGSVVVDIEIEGGLKGDKLTGGCR